MPEYAIILIIFLLIAVFIQKKYRLTIYRSTRQMIVTNILFFVVAVLWDQYAIWRGHWFFGEQFLLGPKIGYMPIEEFGFTFIMPYFVLVLYRVIEQKGSDLPGRSDLIIQYKSCPTSGLSSQQAC